MGVRDAQTGGECVLAFDLGTSSLKAALVSPRGEILAGEAEPLEVSLLPGGGAEQSPDHWWRAMGAAARRLLGRMGLAHSVVAVNASVQWSGTVPVTGDGRPLMNAIIWMDARGADEVRRITRGVPSIQGYGARKLATWIRRTGGAPGHSGKDPVAHILYLRRHVPEVYREARLFLEPKDYVNLLLTGRAASSFDAITLHWVTDNRDLSNVRYDDRLLDLAELEREKLPDLVPPASILGTLTTGAADHLGLPHRVPVASGAPDVLAAAVGSGAIRDFEAHLCVGTSSWLTCHVPYKKTDLFHNMASLPSAIPGRYLLTNEQESAGLCLAFLRNNVLMADDGLAPAFRPDEAPGNPYAAFDRIAERIAPGSEGVIFTPWLNGERSPVDDRTARAGFFNLSLATTRGHLVRAVLEGVAYNSRWLRGYVERFIGRRLDAIAMVGGGARSDVWCQIHADVLDRPILQVADPLLANARGAALLAVAALGRISFGDIPSLVPVQRRYEPNPRNRATYDRLFEEFLHLYRATRGVSGRLNRARAEG